MLSEKKLEIKLGFEDKTNEQISIDLLVQNPNAAVVDPRLRLRRRNLQEEKDGKKS